MTHTFGPSDANTSSGRQDRSPQADSGEKPDSSRFSRLLVPRAGLEPIQTIRWTTTSDLDRSRSVTTKIEECRCRPGLPMTSKMSPNVESALHQWPARRVGCLVPRAGLEPARPCGQRILSPQRLPIPPPGLRREKWRLGSESNRRPRLCRPLHNHSAT